MTVVNPLKRYYGWTRVGNRTGARPTKALLRVERLEERTVLDALPTPLIFQNPFMAPNNFSEIHLNSYQTDTTSASGPADALSQTVQQGLLGPLPGIGGTMSFNSSGQIITIKAGPSTTPGEAAQSLLLLDPVTLNVLAKTDLPPRTISSGVSFAGGGYFYLDNQDRVVCVTANQQIQIYGVQENQFVLAQSFDLSAAINNPSDILNSVLPDSAGNLWFITNQGDVGYVDPVSGTIHVGSVRNVSDADPKETITKSFATDAGGGVYVVSDYALYRFQIDPDGAPESTWRSAYDRGTQIKPGQNQQGSGTTPTVFDDFAPNQFVAITDNADPFMHVNVYNRQTGVLVAQQAVFSAFPNRNACENSLIAVNHSIIVENNYGNADIMSTFGPLTTVPGVDRVDFDSSTGQSVVVWETPTVAVPSVVSQLSASDGLVYTYAKDARGWYFTALDYQIGSVVALSRVPLSNELGGVLANNYYSGLGIGPDGSAYVGVFGGVVAWRPGQAARRSDAHAAIFTTIGEQLFTGVDMVSGIKGHAAVAANNPAVLPSGGPSDVLTPTVNSEIRPVRKVQVGPQILVDDLSPLLIQDALGPLPFLALEHGTRSS
jgi:hypothetical protein